MPSLSTKIATILVENRIVEEDDRDLYEYGFHQLSFTLLNLFTDIIIGAISGMLWESVLFLAVYISLRKCAGGFHAKTELRCYGLSTFLLCFGLLAIYEFETALSNPLWVLFVFASACLVIAILAPIESINKPLDKIERTVFRKWSRVFIAIHSGCFGYLMLTEAKNAAAVIAVADGVLSVMLILGYLKNNATLQNVMES